MKKAAFLFVSAIMLFVSCEKNDDSISNGPGVATLETTDISCSSATFNGKIRVPNQIGTDFEFGFELSESESFDERTTTSYSVEIYSGNDMSYSFVLKYALKPEHRYYVRAYMYNIKSIYYGSVRTFKTKNWQPEYIDLGLSVKWATCNIGATSPDEYGDYFAWGETQPKSDYSWNTYKYCNGNDDIMTKYCNNSSYGIVDNKTVLDPADDAAHIKWGGSWRMPTSAEFEELRTDCTWMWTTQYGVYGYKVVSKTNGNFIFLPAAGARYDTSLGYAGSAGNYWSGSLENFISFPVLALGLAISQESYCGLLDERRAGNSVRPVLP